MMLGGMPRALRPLTGAGAFGLLVCVLLFGTIRSEESSATRDTSLVQLGRLPVQHSAAAHHTSSGRFPLVQRVLSRGLLQQPAPAAEPEGRAEYPQEADVPCPLPLAPRAELRIYRTCTMRGLPAQLDRPGAAMEGVAPSEVQNDTNTLPMVLVPDDKASTEVQPGE